VLRVVITAVGALAVVWLALVIFLAVFQRQIIYLPDGAEPVAPDDVEEVAYVTDDGLRLDGWLVSTTGEAVTTVLVAPGNAGNRGHRLLLARGLAERGHDVFLLDYRGYGGNPGSPSEEGLLVDARAARDHLVTERGVDEDRLAYLGESVGTGVAAGLAAQSPPAALVLRSPFPELAAVGRSVYPFLPVGTLLRDRFPVTEHLAAYDGPVLVVAGDADRIVPTRLSVQVAEAAGADLSVIGGVGHNDRALLDGDRFLDAVDEHLRSAVASTD
jgi:uncharacterized protein